MATKERDVVMEGKDVDGNPTMDFPLGRLGWIEGDAPVKDALVEGDCIACVDSASGMVKKTPVRFVSNPDILINSDFRKPVNRNGKTEYTGFGYTIDRWVVSGDGASMSIREDCIHLLMTGSWCNFVQKVENWEQFKGKTLTFSVFGSGSFSVIVDIGGNRYPDAARSDGSTGVTWFSTVIPDDTTGLGFIIQPQDKNGQDIYAAKLELGDHQTLAHQDASGNWVLNDPPNYDLQYALCSQYSPTTGEWVGHQHSNPNLLDNWYFADPINQRGQTEYTGRRYTIDRWFSYEGTISVQPGVGIKVVSFTQPVENIAQLLNRQLTFSVLLADGRLLSGANLISDVASSVTFAAKENIKILFQSAPPTGFQIYDSTKQGVIVVAAKLELGSVQTLAHQDTSGNWVLNDPPPNKALELAKCQRYQYVVNAAGNAVASFGQGPVRSDGAVGFVFVPIPNMRNFPALSTVGKFKLYSVESNQEVSVSKVEIYRNAKDGKIDLSAFANGLVPGEIYQLIAVDATSRIIFDANI